MPFRGPCATRSSSVFAPLARSGNVRGQKLLTFAGLLAAWALAALPGHAQVVVATPGVGANPVAVAVNLVTKKIYVANYSGSSVSVIDGATDSVVSTIGVGAHPDGIAVNPVTNKIYVANNNSSSVSVIDGANDSVVATIGVGANPYRIAVNPVTNKIYVVNFGGSSVSVIDGATDSVVATPSVGTSPTAVAVNLVTKKIYVATYSGSSVSVIDGATDSVVSTIGVGAIPDGIAVNPVTNKIYVANYSGSVSVIDGATNSVVATPTVGSDPYAIAINPVTNQIFVVNIGDNTVSVIDGATDKKVATPTVGPSPDSIAVNPVTNQIYVGNGADNSVSVIDGATNSVVATPTVGSDPYAIAINPVTNQIFVSNNGDNTVSMIDGAANSIVATPTIGSDPNPIAVNPVTDRIFIANSGDGTVSVIDGVTNSVVATPGVGANPLAIAVNPVTSRIFVANNGDNTVSILDGATSDLVAGPGVGSSPVAVAVNPVTNLAYVANSGSNTVSVIDGATNSVVATPTVGSYPDAVAVNQATNQVYATNRQDGTVSVIDGATNIVKATLAVGTGRHAIAVNPATNRVYIANASSGNVTALDGATNTVITTVTAGSGPSAIAINLTTQKIYVANSDSNTVSVIDGTTNRVVATLPAGTDPVAIAIDPVTDQVYVTDFGGFVTAIDGATNTVLATLPVGTDPNAMAINPVTHQVYVVNNASNTVSVIAANQISQIPLSSVAEIAGDSLTVSAAAPFVTRSTEPVLTVTVTSNYAGSSTYLGSPGTAVNPPPTAVYYWIDNGSAVTGKSSQWAIAADRSGAGANPAAFNLQLSGQSPGLHTLYYYAAYGDEGTPASDGNGTVNSPEISNLQQIVYEILPAESSTAVTADVNPQSVNGTVNLTATITPGAGRSTGPTGTVYFYDGSTLLGSSALAQSGNTYTAAYPWANVADGSHNIAALYGGDGHYASSSGSLTETVEGAPASIAILSGNNQTASVGSAFASVLEVQVLDARGIPLPNVAVNFSGTGFSFSSGGVASTDSNGKAGIAATPLSTGALTAIASITGTAATASFAETGSNAVTTQLALTASAASSTYGQSVTLTAALTPFASGAATTNGLSVTFSNGGTVLGVGTFSNGVATLTTSLLPAGANGLTAVYSPPASKNGLSGSSGSLSFTVAPASLTVAVSDISIVYGSAIPSLGGTVQGIVNNDAITVSYAVQGMTSPNAGAYVIAATLSGSALNNYSVTNPGGTLTISKATATVALNNLGQTYTGSPLSATATASFGSSSISPNSISITYDGSVSAPSAAGTYTVVATINDPNYQGASTATLVIAKAAPTIAWTAPAAITYGTPLSPTQLSANSGVAGTYVYSPAAGTVLTAGAQTLTVTFTPTDTADYNGAGASVKLTVNQATPSIAWPAPAAIGYGVALSATQLNATSPVNGTFTYTPADGAVLTAGSQMLSVTFAPSDAADYSPATAQVALTVNPSAPILSWAAPTAIAYGTALSALQLSASSPVAGKFTYTPAAGSVLTAGTQTLSVTFTPNDTTDYSATTQTTTLTVTKATPTIAWPAPSAISYGTALSAAQLNATSPVSGTFVYSPAAGTILTVGTQTLEATFIPADTADYTTAAKPVSLIVNQATPVITWPIPTPITAGTALGSVQLDATSGVQGTFVYTPAAGTVPAAGSDVLTAVFTPTDTTDYAAATATVTLTVTTSNTPPLPIPSITNLSPAFVATGSGAFSLTVSGSNFTSSSTVYWGASPLTTQFLSANQLTAQVPATAISSSGINDITVQISGPSPTISFPILFEVDSAADGTSAPAFVNLAATVTQGSAATYQIKLPTGVSNVSISCLNLPSLSNCSYASASNTVTILTASGTPAGVYQVTVIFSETVSSTQSAALFWPLLLLPLARFRKRLVNKKAWIAACFGMILVGVAAISTGCGGGSNTNTVTDATTSTEVNRSAVVSLTVQ